MSSGVEMRELGAGCKVTRGTEAVEAELHREERRMAELERGLKRCLVCGGEARIVVFGLEGLGVWVGCDRGEECAKYIEMHTEGWSVEEVAGEWNRNNSGAYGMIRKVKGWYLSRFGAKKRAERKREKGIMREKERLEAIRREVFGVAKKKNGGWRGRILALGQRIWRKYIPEKGKKEGGTEK